MHECPECGQACACDQEDTWMDIAWVPGGDCEHVCDPNDDDDLEYGSEEDDDAPPLSAGTHDDGKDDR